MRLSVLAALALFSPTDALRLVPPALSRADALRAAFGAAALAAAPRHSLAVDLDDDDDLNQDDEVPDVRMRGGAPRTKPGDKPPPKAKDAAAGKAAFAELVSARKSLDSLAVSLGKGDRAAVGKVLADAPFSTLEENLLTLVQSPVLGVDDKKQIGTIKRYGVGADVLIMAGGLNSAVANGGDAKGYLTKTSDALDEVILICKGAGLKP